MKCFIVNELARCVHATFCARRRHEYCKKLKDLKNVITGLDEPFQRVFSRAY